METQCIAAANAWLVRAGLAREDAERLARVAWRLAREVDPARTGAIAVSGAPGTGKSTLAGAVAAALDARGVEAFTLSLDDYYLGAAERERLARDVHPLFRQRGVPGTHDRDMLVADLRALLDGRLGALTLPRFDKAADDRAPAGRRPPDHAPAVVLVEGWLVGVPPETTQALANPANAWEAARDPDGAWRGAVHRHHEALHRALASLLGRRWYLRAPDWPAVIRWREAQEARLPQPALRDRAAVEAFLQPFERLVRHAQRTCGTWADVVVHLDESHRPNEVQRPGGTQ